MMSMDKEHDDVCTMEEAQAAQKARHEAQLAKYPIPTGAWIGEGRWDVDPPVKWIGEGQWD